MLKKCLLIGMISILLAVPATIKGQGFAAFELSARAASLGGAFTARADDITTIFYNPAGLAYLNGFRVKTNLMYNYLTTTAFNPAVDATYRSSPLQIRGSYYISLKPIDRLALGIGIFNPYFSHVDWPWSWPGRPLSSTSRLNAHFIRPTAALKVFEGLSIAVGLDIVRANMEWMHAQAIQWGTYRRYMDMRMTAKGSGTGYNLSVMLKPMNNLRLGAKYQHEVKINFKGTNNFYSFGWEDDTWLPNPYLDPNPITLPEWTYTYIFPISSQITLPSEMSFGFYYAPISRVSIQFDLQHHSWSSIRQWRIDSTDPATPFTQYADLNWKDAWRAKFGLEFFLNQYFALRGGYTHINNPASDAGVQPVCPSLGQKAVSIGIGYEGPFFSIWDYEKSGELSFDIFFQYFLSEQAPAALSMYPYDYDADRWLIGIGFGLNF